MRNFGKNFETVLPQSFSLGVRSEKEASNASLSLRHLSLWLKNESPSSLRGFQELSGVPTVLTVKESHGGLGCCPIWQPRSIRLPQLYRLCKTVFVKESSVANRLGLVHSTPFPQKQRTARCKTRYGTKAPDEYDEKDNPGKRAGDRSCNRRDAPVTGIPARVINLSRSIPDLLLSEYDVAPSGKCQGMRLLWLKFSCDSNTTPSLSLRSPRETMLLVWRRMFSPLSALERTTSNTIHPRTYFAPPHKRTGICTLVECSGSMYGLQFAPPEETKAKTSTRSDSLRASYRRRPYRWRTYPMVATIARGLTQ